MGEMASSMVWILAVNDRVSAQRYAQKMHIYAVARVFVFSPFLSVFVFGYFRLGKWATVGQISPIWPFLNC